MTKRRPNRVELRRAGMLRGPKFTSMAGTAIGVAAHAGKTPASLYTHVQVIQWKVIDGRQRRVRLSIPIEMFRRGQ